MPPRLHPPVPAHPHRCRGHRLTKQRHLPAGQPALTHQRQRAIQARAVRHAPPREPHPPSAHGHHPRRDAHPSILPTSGPTCGNSGTSRTGVEQHNEAPGTRTDLDNPSLTRSLLTRQATTHQPHPTVTLQPSTRNSEPPTPQPQTTPNRLSPRHCNTTPVTEISRTRAAVPYPPADVS